MDLKLGERQYTTIHLDGLDPLHEKGSFQSAPKWSCSDSTILKITPDEDGCCCRIEAARPVLFGTATVSVTDRDDSSVPPVIFNITVTKDPITNLGVTIDPATDLGQQPAVRSERKNTPLPEGAVQKDPNTGLIRRETDADTGDKGPGRVTDVKIPGGGSADNNPPKNPTDSFAGEKKPAQTDAQGKLPGQPTQPQ